MTAQELDEWAPISSLFAPGSMMSLAARSRVPARKYLRAC